MRYLAFATFLIFLASCSQNCSKDTFNPEAINLNDKGSKFHLMFQYDSAIVFYNKAIEVDQCYYLPHSNLASIYIAEKDFDNTLQQIELSLEKKPDLTEGWMLAGMLNELKGNSEKSQESYNKSIELYQNKLDSIDSSEVNELNHIKFNLAIVLELSGKKSKGKKYIEKLALENPNSIKYERALNYSRNDWYQTILGVEKNENK